MARHQFSRYFPPPKRRLSAHVGRVVFLAFIVVILIRIFGSDKNATPSRNTTAETAVASVSQIQEQLSAAPLGEMREGIALAILLDTSGSMRNSAGGQRKLDAAKTAVLELVETSARIAADRPETPVLLGLYEFSTGDQVQVRQVIALSPPDPDAARQRIEGVIAGGNTPIGDAILRAKRDLDATGMYRQHILVVTDGENTAGPLPQAVLLAMNALEDRPPTAIYFVAFDIGAEVFDPVKQAGGVVLPAVNPGQLRQVLDELLTGRIMVE